jgi:AcrR family transcriptional regulator
VAAQQSRGQLTIRRLLDAAMLRYEQAGPEGFTMTAVTEASGVSVGSLYHHFGSFDGLAAALYRECMDDLLDALIAALRRTRTARTGIMAVVAAYLLWARDNRARAHFIHASAYAAFPPTHAPRITAAKTPGTAVIIDWLRGHIEAGRVVDLPVPLIEMLVIGPPAETTRRWLAGVPGIDLDQARRALPERVWQSIRGPIG